MTLDGQPLSNSHIVFENIARGVSVNVPLAPDGTYIVQTFYQAGLPPGKYAVAVQAGSMQMVEEPLISEAPTSEQPPPLSHIPERYRDAATSGLAIDVVAGGNPPQNFELLTGPS